MNDRGKEQMRMQERVMSALENISSQEPTGDTEKDELAAVKDALQRLESMNWYRLFW
jgi:hypothetical protein